MKILTISNCPLLESQGSGYAIINFSQGLRGRNNSVDLYGPEAFELFHGLGIAKRYRQALGMLLFVLRQISTDSFDLIEFYGAECWLTIIVLRKILKYEKALLVCHSNGIETHAEEVFTRELGAVAIDGSPRKWYQIDQSGLFDIAFQDTHGIVTASNYDRDYVLMRNYKDKDHVSTVEYGLLDSFLNLDVEFERPQVIGYCGSWIARKGTDLIRSDMVRILQEFPECVFKLIGVGENFKKELYFPADLGLRIEVIPFIYDRQKLCEVYQSLSILLIPSIYESFGLVTAEAMACGCAVVASRVGFAASLNHREEALVIDPPISPHLYEAVKELILDEPFRLQLARAGYQRVQKLRWSSAVSRLEALYSDWLAEIRQKSI